MPGRPSFPGQQRLSLLPCFISLAVCILRLEVRNVSRRGTPLLWIMRVWVATATRDDDFGK